MRLVFYLCLGRFNFVEPVILGWYRLGHGKGDRMADLAACLADPVIFAEAFLGWKAHPHQAEWLRGSTKQLNWCRAGNRWGKTESIAINIYGNAFFVNVFNLLIGLTSRLIRPFHWIRPG